MSNTPMMKPTTENAAAGLPEDMTLAELQQFLSDEEIEALTTGDDAMVLADPNATKPDPTELNDDDLDDDQDDDDPAAPAVVDPAAGVAADVPGFDPDAADPAPPVAPDVSEHEAKIAAFDDQIAKLADAYDSGEHTRNEWMALQKAVVAEQTKAIIARDNELSSVTDDQEAFRQGWYDRVAAYQAQHPYLASPEHYDGWDAALKAAFQSYPNLPMLGRIEQAHRMLAAHVEGTTGKELPTKAGFRRKEGAPPLRTDPRPDAPTTLSGFTQADVQSVDGSKFAAIDRISATDPERAEALVAAMSDAERHAYLTT